MILFASPARSSLRTINLMVVWSVTSIVNHMDKMEKEFARSDVRPQKKHQKHPSPLARTRKFFPRRYGR